MRGTLAVAQRAAHYTHLHNRQQVVLQQHRYGAQCAKPSRAVKGFAERLGDCAQAVSGVLVSCRKAPRNAVHPYHHVCM